MNAPKSAEKSEFVPVPADVLAYTAGVIDSDGSIGIQRETWPMRVHRASQPTFSERVTIRQVEPEAVDLIHQHFGGSRYVIRYRGERSGRQPLQSVVLADRKASALLSAVLPYLRIKRGQAELCLALRKLKEDSRRARFAFGRGHRGGGRRPDALSAAMDAIHAEMLRLNRVDDRSVRRNPSKPVELSEPALAGTATATVVMLPATSTGSSSRATAPSPGSPSPPL